MYKNAKDVNFEVFDLDYVAKSQRNLQKLAESYRIFQNVANLKLQKLTWVPGL